MINYIGVINNLPVLCTTLQEMTIGFILYLYSLLKIHVDHCILLPSKCSPSLLFLLKYFIIIMK